MYWLSVLFFVTGLIVLIAILHKQKKEEEYYDRFYFIVSKHDTIDDYLSPKNRIKDFFSQLKRKTCAFVEKYLSHTDFHRLVVNAGFYSLEHTVVFYLMALFIFVLSLIAILTLVYLGRLPAMFLPSFTVLYYLGMKLFLEGKHKRELRKYRKDFVYFLDLTSTCIKTGMTLTVSLDAVSTMLFKFSPLLSNSIQAFNRTMKFSSLDDACERLYKDVPLTEVSEFISTVKNSAQFGSGMYDSLQDLAEEIRKFHFIETEEKIGQVNAKIGIPLILFIMFPIIVEIIAPGLLRIMGTLSLDSLL